MSESVIEMYERIIKMQQDQINKYHDYVMMLLNSTPHHHYTPKNISNSYNMNMDFEPLFGFVKINLENMDNDRLLSYLESSEHNISGMVALIELGLCPDKSNLNFHILSGGSFVKYKNDENVIINENITDFSNKVCTLIHDYCKPIITIENERVGQNINDNANDDTVLDSICDKNLIRIKNLTNFKFSDSQVRLIKKVFSGIKSK